MLAHHRALHAYQRAMFALHRAMFVWQIAFPSTQDRNAGDSVKHCVSSVKLCVINCNANDQDFRHEVAVYPSPAAIPEKPGGNPGKTGRQRLGNTKYEFKTTSCKDNIKMNNDTICKQPYVAPSGRQPVCRIYTQGVAPG